MSNRKSNTGNAGNAATAATDNADTSRVFKTQHIAEHFGVPTKTIRRRMRAVGIRCGSGNRHAFTKSEFDAICAALKHAGQIRRVPVVIPTIADIDAMFRTSDTDDAAEHVRPMHTRSRG